MGDGGAIDSRLLHAPPDPRRFRPCCGTGHGRSIEPRWRPSRSVSHYMVGPAVVKLPVSVTFVPSIFVTCMLRYFRRGFCRFNSFASRSTMGKICSIWARSRIACSPVSRAICRRMPAYRPRYVRYFHSDFRCQPHRTSGIGCWLRSKDGVSVLADRPRPLDCSPLDGTAS
jgi:hypothetical protein